MLDLAEQAFQRLFRRLLQRVPKQWIGCLVLLFDTLRLRENEGRSSIPSVPSLLATRSLRRRRSRGGPNPPNPLSTLAELAAGCIRLGCRRAAIARRVREEPGPPDRQGRELAVEAVTLAETAFGGRHASRGPWLKPRTAAAAVRGALPPTCRGMFRVSVGRKIEPPLNPRKWRRCKAWGFAARPAFRSSQNLRGLHFYQRATSSRPASVDPSPDRRVALVAHLSLAAAAPRWANRR